MEGYKRMGKWLALFSFTLALLLLAYLSMPVEGSPNFTGFSSLVVRCTQCSTATPVALLDAASGAGGGVVEEKRVNATPVQRTLLTGDVDMMSHNLLNVSGITITTVTLGSNYPLQHPVVNMEWACGEQTITGSAFITNTGLTTASKVLPVLASNPIDGQVGLVTAADPTTSAITINVWRVGVVTPTDQITYSVATVGALVHWCALGNR